MKNLTAFAKDGTIDFIWIAVTIFLLLALIVTWVLFKLYVKTHKEIYPEEKKEKSQDDEIEKQKDGSKKGE